MSVKWFVLVDGVTCGPFSTEQCEGLLSKSSSDSLVWWRGQTDWIRPDEWYNVRDEVLAAANKVKQKQWKIRNGEDEMGPFIEEDLIERLREMRDFNKVEIWTEGLVQWEPVYNIHQFMDSLGVCRRRHPRVAVDANVHLTDREIDILSSAVTISEGGLGVKNVSGLELGKKVSLVLKSPDIPIPIRATAAVVYVSPNNQAGLRFDYIMPECKAAIIEYVKRETTTEEFAA